MTANNDPDAAPDENRRRFLEALAAKQGRHGENHVDRDPRQAHAHGPVGLKRTFRRKTG